MKEKYKPDKNTFYTFIFNLILLLITFAVGDSYINYKLLNVEQTRIEQQNLIQQKNQFVNDFANSIQKRTYLAENYYYNKKNNENDDVLKRSWEDYMKAVIFWNENNLSNPIFIKYYFGNKAQEDFNNLLPKIVKSHEKILAIRDGSTDYGDTEQAMEEAKHESFVFTETLLEY